MGVYIAEILKAEKCARCKKEIPEDTVVLVIFLGSTQEIICRNCVEVLWKNVEVRNKLNKEEVRKRNDRKLFTISNLAT